MKDSADLLKLIVNYSGPRYQLIDKIQKYLAEIRQKPDYANTSESDLLRVALQKVLQEEEKNAKKSLSPESQ